MSRSTQTFFEAEDYVAYRELLATHCAAASGAVQEQALTPMPV